MLVAGLTADSCSAGASVVTFGAAVSDGVSSVDLAGSAGVGDGALSVSELFSAPGGKMFCR